MSGRRGAYGAAALLAALAVGLLLGPLGLGERWEQATWSWRAAAFAAPGPTTDRIVVIAIDQASLDWAERENGLSWPWPRQVYNPLLAYCRRQGARAVVFDTLFTEPSPLAGDDEAFAAALAEPPPTVLPVGFGSGAAAAELPPAKLLPLAGPAAAAGRASGAGGAGPAGRFKPPVAPLREACDLLAHVQDRPDADAVVRRVTLLRRRGGRALPALGLAAWWVARPEPELRLARGGALLDGRRVPLDEEGRVLLRFRGPSGTHRTLPAAAVLQSELRLREGGEPPIRDASLLRDRIVLIGATAPGLLDLRAAPVDPVYPGVEIHATLLDNLLAGDALRDAPAALWWAATGLLVLLAAGATVLLCRGWGEVALVCLALAPLPAALAFAAYPLGYWWPLVAPAGAVLTALGGGVAARYALEEREKAFVTRAFQHYLSPAVMEQVLAEPERLRLGGERRELSIFFSDLQGFTSLSEGLEPEALVALLNEYLTEMTDLILAADGTLDKYEGDAILAFWNAPVGQADHAARAAATARRCQQALARRRREWAARCGTELQMRIGIHTGEVIVGNLGSRARFDYTVLGDAANLASRLEGANKFFGTVTMVSEATWRGAGGAPGRELGRLRVVGRQEPVRVYELFAAAPPDWLPAYEAALAAVRAGDWARARARFEPLAERDPVAARYAARCREILTGERAGWDGVWALSEK